MGCSTSASEGDAVEKTILLGPGGQDSLYLCWSGPTAGPEANLPSYTYSLYNLCFCQAEGRRNSRHTLEDGAAALSRTCEIDVAAAGAEAEEQLHGSALPDKGDGAVTQTYLRDHAYSLSSRFGTTVHNRGMLEDFYDVANNVLGAGYFGKAHQASSRRMPKPNGVVPTSFAMKTIPKPAPGGPLEKRLSKFIDVELNLSLTLDHPNIVKLFEVFEDASNVYMILEMCDSGSLLKQLGQTDYFTEKKVRIIMHQVLRAVQYMHSSLAVHRDIKLANILVANSPQMDTQTLRTAVRLIDFGISRRFTQGQKMTLDVGTPSHMAPEVIKLEYDNACDLWSCGVIMYHMLCGEVPFLGENDDETKKLVTLGRYQYTTSVWADISAPGLNFLAKLLSVKPETRLTAQQGLLHKWILDGSETVQMPLLTRDILTRMRNYRKLGVLRRKSLRVLASVIKDQYVKNSREFFLQLDVGGDGFICRDDLLLAGEMDLFKTQDGQIDENIVEEIDKTTVSAVSTASASALSVESAA
eukprot:TRINITY_DN33688_c0_g1_i1.p1 TRINITY_DN33688_c0_g1~~TRINITY_DN33688_c0_g1_i1.p1  ORF type:complete len:526 (-),score=80.04 TRINITY_DN33688_c0_g1_i1:710-2287(-)